MSPVQIPTIYTNINQNTIPFVQQPITTNVVIPSSVTIANTQASSSTDSPYTTCSMLGCINKKMQIPGCRFCKKCYIKANGYRVLPDEVITAITSSISDNTQPVTVSSSTQPIIVSSSTQPENTTASSSTGSSYSPCIMLGCSKERMRLPDQRVCEYCKECYMKAYGYVLMFS
jgi:hypothetical protein